MEKRRPPWLRGKMRLGEDFLAMERVLKRWKLNTVCREASCPNIGECFSNKTATFLILGDFCTRTCAFCGVKKGIPLAPDPTEPERVAHAVRDIGLSHVVITSVTRDDLFDGGAIAFAQTIRAIKEVNPDSVVEVLIPDLKGSQDSLEILLNASPQIVGHNLEVVPRFYPQARSDANYERSRMVLRKVKEFSSLVVTKSGLMVGVGEEKKEILDVMDDLREVDCDLLTLGQYLPPTAHNLPVQRYYTPCEFDELSQEGMKRGFRWVESGPLVRSSYHATRQLENALTVPCRFGS